MTGPKPSHIIMIGRGVCGQGVGHSLASSQVNMIVITRTFEQVFDGVVCVRFGRVARGGVVCTLMPSYYLMGDC